MKRLLVLGAGLVSPPLIRYFLPRRDVRIAVAALDFSRVAPLAAGHEDRVQMVRADVGDEATVRQLVREADAVVSLLPAPLLPAAAKIAVEERRHLVSTSYTSDAMRALDPGARSAGVLLLNEMGFDPGIDHMTAMRVIGRVKSRGGTIASFRSAAAGLPAPDADTNPWHYKFSWSPRGVIAAAQADARFLRGGEVVHVRGRDLIHHTSTEHVENLGDLEVYPNRDSLVYRDLYGLGSAATVFRGTMRYPGWMETMTAAADLGWLDPRETTWPPGTTYARISGDVAVSGDAAERLRWAGFFSDEPIPRTTAAPLDLFVERLEQVLRYEPGERDMALMQHRFEASHRDGGHQTIVSALKAFGDPHGDSAMSRLVGLPAAIAANLILDKRIVAAGVQIPIVPEIYEPALEELSAAGIEPEERTISASPNSPAEG